MPMIENFLRWSAIAVVVLMVLSGVGSAVFAGAVGLMSDPTFMVIVFVGFLFFAALVAIPVALVGAVGWRWWQRSRIDADRRAEFVAPDEHGRLPVPASLLRQPDFANRALDVHAASYNSNLHTFNYAPQHNQTLNGADGQAMTTAAVAAAADAGTFWQLYQSGALPDSGFLMGYDSTNGDPVVANWKQLYSALVGGMSGSGKSTIVRLLLAQAALQQGKFVVVDPHYGSGDESLGASLMAFRGLMVCDVAGDEKQIVDALRWVADTGRRRLQGIDADRTPLVLIVDETPGLLEGGYGDDAQAQLLQTLNLVVRETRKVNVFAFAIGQTFQADTMPSKIRNSFASMVGCVMRKDEARYMSGNSRFARAVDELSGYQAVWMNPQREVITLTVPNCTQKDVELVAGRVLGANMEPVVDDDDLQVVGSGSGSGSISGSASGSEPLSRSYLERHFPTSGTTTGTTSGTTIGTTNARAERVRSLILDGKNMSQIITEVWRIDGRGRAYQSAVEEYYQVLQSLLGGN